MDGERSRPRIVENFNSAYSRENIEITVRKLKDLPPDADFLDFARKADVLLEPMTDAQFRRYRQYIDARVPQPLQEMLTTIHRAALLEFPPTPMHLEMNDKTPASLRVTIIGPGCVTMKQAKRWRSFSRSGVPSCPS